MRPLRAFLGLSLLVSSACVHGGNISTPPPDLAARSQHLAQRLIIADGHIDMPYRLNGGRSPEGAFSEDVAQRTAQGDFDYPRAREGGLDVAFMAIYVPAELQATPGRSKALADGLIDMTETIVRAAPDKFALVSSPDEVERNSREGKISFALGIENGSALEDAVANVAHFHARGVRYITLTHSKDNLLGDSSYNQEKRTWNGLSPLGRQVVAEMNRVGIMVDVAHVSDDVIRQVLALSQVPVIASHSSCRHFTPGFERNLSDELIQAVAAQGGVVMINFGSGFLLQAAHDAEARVRQAVQDFKAQKGPAVTPAETEAFVKAYVSEHPMPRARVEDVADHIDHVVKLVGIDHVGFGSDFDGVGPTLPVGLEDVSKYPNLLRVLLERGYSEGDLEKLASGNVFRVWRQVEAHARGR